MPTSGKGFWGRLLATARSIASSLPTIGAILDVCEKITGWNFSDNFKITINDLDGLTPQESSELTTWDDKVFTPFYLALLQESNNIFQKNITLQVQIERANKVLNKICAVQTYFGKNPNNISQKANGVRLNYITTSTIGIISYINAQFEQRDNLEFKPSNVTLASLQLIGIIGGSASSNVSCANYFLKTSVSTTTPSLPPAEVEVVPTTNQTQLPTNNNTGVNSPEDKKATSYVVPVFAVGLIITAIAISSKDE